MPSSIPHSLKRLTEPRRGGIAALRNHFRTALRGSADRRTRPESAGPAAGCRPSSPERPRRIRDTLTTTSSKMLCSCVSMGTIDIAIVPPVCPPLDGHGGAGRPLQPEVPSLRLSRSSGGAGRAQRLRAEPWVAAYRCVSLLAFRFCAASVLHPCTETAVNSVRATCRSVSVHCGQTGWSFTKW